MKWLSLYETGETISIDRDSKIEVPEDRFGLYAIDVLDPDMVTFVLMLPLFYFPFFMVECFCVYISFFLSIVCIT